MFDERVSLYNTNKEYRPNFENPYDFIDDDHDDDGFDELISQIEDQELLIHEMMLADKYRKL
jgi:hypothetical protein